VLESRSRDRVEGAERLVHQHDGRVGGERAREPHPLALAPGELGGDYEVVHHTQLLNHLVEEGRLTPVTPIDQLVTYHDPCYLGRHNGIYDEPREALRQVPELDLVELPAEDYRGRYAAQLSGGERQRVGLARALAADPPVMLMDEPFGALDPITRTRLQKELLRIQAEVRKTIVFVTHDIDEAILIGDRIAILREGGQLVQVDTPERLLAHPADEFVARFVGADRGLKRLSLTTLAEVELDPPNGAVAPTAGADTTLRDALSLMLSEGSRSLVVLGGDERPRGVLTFDRLTELLR